MIARESKYITTMANSNKQNAIQLKAKLDGFNELSDEVYQKILNALEEHSTMPGFTKDNKLKVAMFDAKNYDLDAFRQANNKEIELLAHQVPLDQRTAMLAKGSKVVCVFVNDSLDKSVIKILKKLGVELIALRCAGFNNVDLEQCKKDAIDVVRVPAYSPQAVAEHSVALMLMLNRNLHKAYLRNRSGQFVLDGLVGFNMYQKTVGVIGTGKIGKCVIDILLGFGCKILAYDKFPNPELASNNHIEYTELPGLLAKSDIITLHAPLVEETYHCIDDTAINTMQDGVMIINTSRGGLIDTKALIRGLKTGKISSAGLDVYEEEAGIFFKDMSNQILNDDVFARLLSFSNVVVTSHQAFLTQEALSNIAETTISNILEYKDGKKGQQLTNNLIE